MAPTRRLAAVLFTDMVGFTAAAQRHEASALGLLQEQERLVRPIFRQFGGSEVKSTGDGSLVEFPSALQAAECAVAIQVRLHARNLDAGRAGQPIHLRVGLHLGDVESRESDIFGDTVNLAARVVSLAEPDGVALTEQVAGHLENKLEFPVEALGPRGVKGVDRPVSVYRVVFPWSGPAPPPSPTTLPRLAVLPLRNISPDPSDAYFAEGLTEELVSVLGRLGELRVIARSSAARFQGQDRPLPEIGRELGATAVLEGAVRKAGALLRISLQLVDVQSQETLWTQTFDRGVADIFGVQAEVGERTAAALKIRLLGRERAAIHHPPTTNLSAYGLYLQAIHMNRQGKVETGSKEIDLLRQAIREDPSFASAYARLANRLLGAIGESVSAERVLPEARALIARALELDPNSSESHSAKGNLAMQADLDWATAAAEFRKALELNPSDADARLWYALLLRALQRYSEAAEQYRSVIELDPLSAGAYSFLGSVMRLTGDFEGAERLVRSSLRNFVTPAELHVTLAYGQFYAGHDDEARRSLESARALDPGAMNLDRAILCARLGEPAEAQALLKEGERKAEHSYVPRLQLALLSSALGEKEKAIGYLEEEWSRGDRGLWYAYQGLGFDPIRTDPRFVRLLERMGLPTSAPFHRQGRAR